MLLVLALLGGGLICLLVINTTLASASFRISHLEQSYAAQTQRLATLRQEVASQEAPATIEQQAYRLGMRTPALFSFLDLARGTIKTQPRTVPGLIVAPGYTP